MRRKAQRQSAPLRQQIPDKSEEDSMNNGLIGLKGG